MTVSIYCLLLSLLVGEIFSFRVNRKFFGPEKFGPCVLISEAQRFLAFKVFVTFSLYLRGT